MCLSPKFPQDLPWLLRSALLSSFKLFIQHLFVTNISTRLAMTVGICTVFVLAKTYSTSVCIHYSHKTCHDCCGLYYIHHFKELFNICQHYFYKTGHDCWDLHCIHSFKDLFNICLSTLFPQDLPWLYGSVLYSSFLRLIQRLFVN